MTIIKPENQDPYLLPGATTPLVGSEGALNYLFPKYGSDLLSGLSGMAPQQQTLQELLDYYAANSGSTGGGGADHDAVQTVGEMPDLSSLSGYSLRTNGDTLNTNSPYTMSLLDPYGKELSSHQYYTGTDPGGSDSFYRDAALAALAVFGGGALGAGLAGAGAAGAGAGLGAESGALLGSAALEPGALALAGEGAGGALGAGAGMTGAEWGALADNAAGATGGLWGEPAAGMTGAEWGALGDDAAGATSGVFGEPAGTSLGGGGLSSADRAALYGPEGYGPGMTGTQTGAYDTVIGATGSPTLANAAGSLPSGLSNLAGNATSAVGNWWDRLTSLDPTAWQQGLAGIGALGSLFGGKSSSGGGAGAFPTLPGGNAFGANNDWTAAQKPQVSAFFDRPSQPFNWQPRPQGYAEGGEVDEAGMPMGEAPGFDSAQDSYARGPGGGQGDQIDAALSPGEFVWDADVVAAIGDGSNEEGARRLDEMRRMIRERNRSAPPDEIPPKALPLEGYLQQVMKR